MSFHKSHLLQITHFGADRMPSNIIRPICKPGIRDIFCIGLFFIFKLAFVHLSFQMYSFHNVNTEITT